MAAAASTKRGSDARSKSGAKRRARCESPLVELQASGNDRKDAEDANSIILESLLRFAALSQLKSQKSKAELFERLKPSLMTLYERFHSDVIVSHKDPTLSMWYVHTCCETHCLTRGCAAKQARA